MCWTAGGEGSKAEGWAVPSLPSLPLSHLPVTSDIRISENRVQNAPLSACISDPLQAPMQRLNRIGSVGSGEFSAETRRTRTWGMVLPVVCACVVGAGAARLSAHSAPRREAPTTEPATWIAATSSYYTWNITIFPRGDGSHLNIRNLWPLWGEIFWSLNRGKPSFSGVVCGCV